MAALMLLEAVRRLARNAWTLARPYHVAAAAGVIAAAVVMIGGGSWLEVLLAFALIANATQGWLRDQRHRTRIDKLAADLTQTVGERDAARRAWKTAEAENASLRARNEMLSGLVGEERSWPTM